MRLFLEKENVIDFGKAFDIGLFFLFAASGSFYICLKSHTLGLTIGTSLIVAQYFGKGDIPVIEKIQGYSMRMAIIISSVFFFVTVFSRT